MTTQIKVVDQSEVIKPREPIMLDRVSVSRLITYIKRCMVEVGEAFLFEPNDQITREALEGTVRHFMDTLVERKGIVDYLVCCDETNNAPDVIDANELRADVAIKVNEGNEFIYIPMHVVHGSVDDTIERFDRAMEAIFGFGQ